MRFCERFHISPLEYARMPKKKIDLWQQMDFIEANFAKTKRKLDTIKSKSRFK